MKRNSLRKFKKHGPKAVVFLLLAALILTFLPPDPGAFAQYDNNNLAIAEKSGDDSDASNGGSEGKLPGTLAQGQVWTGKTVDAIPLTPAVDELVASPADDHFTVTLSALGRNFSSTANQYDVVFVLDTSGSMGTDVNNTTTKLYKMKTAANLAIHNLLANNTATTYNQVSVVTFNSSAALRQALTNDKNYQIPNSAFGTQNTTYTQAGLYLAMQQLTGNGRDDAKPVIILLSDGAPNQYRNQSFATYTGGTFTDGNGESAGDDPSAAMTILYANYVKASIPDLKFYTVGFDVGSSTRAQAVLNITGLTTQISSAMPAAKTTAGWGDTLSNYTYVATPNGAFMAAVNDDLSGILNQIVTSATANSPITGDLTITDTLGTDDGKGFMFTMSGGKIEFKLDSAPTIYKAEPQGAGIYKYGPTDGITVTFNTTARTVEYKVSAAYLKCLNADTASTASAQLSSISFGVELDGNAAVGTTYYTNASANATFTPAEGNTYYGYVPGTTTVVNGSDEYNNVIQVDGYWDEGYTTQLSGSQIINPSIPTGALSHTHETFDLNSVSFNGYTFTVNDNDISSLSYDGSEEYYTITLSTDTPTELASPHQRIDPNISFRFYPNRTGDARFTQYQTTGGSGDSIRIYSWVDEHWDIAATDSNLNGDLSWNSGDWNHNTSSNTLTMSTVRVTPDSFGLPAGTLPILFNDADSDTVISIGARVDSGSNPDTNSNTYFPIQVVVTDKLVSGYRINANFSFRFYPNNSSSPSNISGSMTRSTQVLGAWATTPATTISGTSINTPAVPSGALTHTNESFDLNSVSFNGYTFTVNNDDYSGPNFNGSEEYYTITLSTDTPTVQETPTKLLIEPRITFDFYPQRTGSAQFANYQNGSSVSDRIRIYEWNPEIAGVTEFTVITPPNAVGQIAKVSIDPDSTPSTGDEKVFEGSATAYTNSTQWTFKQTVTSGNVVTVYTIVRNGNTLTVSFVKTTTTQGYFNSPLVVGGIVTQNLPQTGSIKLRHGMVDLIIKKDVDTYGGAAVIPTGGFQFTVDIPSFTGSVSIFNDDDQAYGTPISFTGGSATFNLPDDGYYAVISDVIIGTSYTVTEADYTTASFVTTSAITTGNGDDNSSNRIVHSTIAPNVSDNVVTFTNTYFSTATIYFDKTILTPFVNDTEIPDGAKFNFTLYATDNTTSLATEVIETDAGDASYSDYISIKLLDLSTSSAVGWTDNQTTLYLKETSIVNAGTDDNGAWSQVDPVTQTVTVYKDGTVKYNDLNNTADTNPVPFSNNFVPMAHLTLTKLVDIGSPLPDGYNFKITLGGSGDPAFDYSYTINNGDDGSGNGTGPTTAPVNITLHQNDTVSFTVPAGLSYSITEDDYSAQHWFATATKGLLTGHVGPDGTDLTVTNTHETNDITVTKSVSSDSHPGDTFTFKVEKQTGLDTYAPVTGFKYTVDGGAEQTASSSTLELKGGQTATLIGLMVGEKYRITEVADTVSADYTPSVAITVGDDDEDALQTNAADLTLTLYDTNVAFLNTYKTGELTVKKSVVVDENNPFPVPSGTKYLIDVKLFGDFLDKVTVSPAAKSVDNSHKDDETDPYITYTLELGSNDSATFSHIPEGVTYSIFEKDYGAADIVNYKYSDPFSRSITCGDKDLVTVQNVYKTAATLTITKDAETTAGGVMPNDTFDYEIHFYYPGGDAQQPYDLDQNGSPSEWPTGSGSSSFVQAMDNNDEPAPVPGVYTFTLADGQSLSFNYLPVGLHYSVWEKTTGGANPATSGVTVNGGTSSPLTNEVTGEIPHDTTGANSINILYTNDFTTTTGTLTLTKSVDDPAHIAGGTYTFEVTFTGQTETGVSLGDNATMLDDYPVADSDNNTVTYRFTVTVGSGASDQVSFSGLYLGTTYVIKEISPDSDTVKIDDSIATLTEGAYSVSGEMERDGDKFSVADVGHTFKNIFTRPTTETVKTAAPMTAEKNDPVVYTVTVTNKSTRTITLNHVKDNMLDERTGAVTVMGPDGEIASSLYEIVPGVPGGESAMIVFTDGVTLEHNQLVTIQYTVKFETSGDKYNMATANAKYNNYTITSWDDVTVHVNPTFKVAIDKMVSDGGPAAPKDVNFASLSFIDTASDAPLHLDNLDTAVYMVTIENKDDGDLSNISLADQTFTTSGFYLRSVTLVSGTTTTTLYTSLVGGTMKFYTDEALSNQVVLHAGDQIVVVYAVPVQHNAEIPVIQNTATVNANDSESLTKSDGTWVVIDQPTISVVKSANQSTILTGGSVTYTVTIDNNYALPLDPVYVIDTYFKTSTDYTLDTSSITVTVGATPLTSSQYTIDSETGTLTFASGVPSFGPDENVVITYTVTFNTPSGENGSTNNVEAKATYRGYDAKGNDSVTIQVNDPTVGFTVDKVVNGQKSITVTPGTVVTYKVTVTNTGEAALNLQNFVDNRFTTAGLTITELTLTTGTTTTPISDYTLIGDTLTINAPEGNRLFLTPGSYVTLTYTLTVTASVPNTVTANLMKANEARVSGSSSAAVTVTVIPPPPPPETPSPSPSPSPSESPSPSPSPSASVLGASDDASGVAGDSDTLPQTDGVSPSTLIGLLGLALIATGGTVFTILKKKGHGNNSEQEQHK